MGQVVLLLSLRCGSLMLWLRHADSPLASLLVFELPHCGMALTPLCPLVTALSVQGAGVPGHWPHLGLVVRRRAVQLVSSSDASRGGSSRRVGGRERGRPNDLFAAAPGRRLSYGGCRAGGGRVQRSSSVVAMGMARCTWEVLQGGMLLASMPLQVARFNHTHRVSDIRRFIRASRPEMMVSAAEYAVAIHVTLQHVALSLFCA